jgi:ubiquinone/menaquinone biosynthesis C-methylase UbiE
MRKYFLYYAGFNKDTGEEQVGVAKSVDLNKWEYLGDKPQIPLKSQGLHDLRQTSNPCVLKHGGLYKMWYQGKSDLGFLSICYAESKDGVSWKAYDKAVLAPSLSGEPEFREGFQHPHVVFDENKNIFKMWCVVYKKGLTSIGFCESVNGLIWSEIKMTNIVSTDENLKYFYPFIMKDNGSYKMWLTERKDSIWKVSYAHSLDGLNWDFYKNNPVISPSTNKLVSLFFEAVAKFTDFSFEVSIYGIGICLLVMKLDQEGNSTYLYMFQMMVCLGKKLKIIFYLNQIQLGIVFSKPTLIYMLNNKREKESDLWNKKYSGSRTYENREDVFRFSKDNPTVLAIEPYIKDGMSILEVGSGTGELISYIQTKYPNCKTTGVDFSRESILRSKNISSKFNLPVNFVESDISSMNFEDEFFDIVFGDQVIGHIEDLELALTEIYRVTKKEGIVAFSIANSLRPDGWYFNKTFSRSHQGYKQKGMFPWTLSKRLKNSGFEKISFYGDMLLLFRNFSIIKSFFSKPTTGERVSSSKLEPVKSNKNFLKKAYYFYDSITPAWLKVTLGILARK